MGVLAAGEREHGCHPGWESVYCDGTGIDAPPAGNYLHDLDCVAGTVWECDDCGQVWIAEAWPEWKATNILLGRIDWRRERPRERRRREKSLSPNRVADG